MSWNALVGASIRLMATRCMHTSVLLEVFWVLQKYVSPNSLRTRSFVVSGRLVMWAVNLTRPAPTVLFAGLCHCQLVFTLTFLFSCLALPLVIGIEFKLFLPAVECGLAIKFHFTLPLNFFYPGLASGASNRMCPSQFILCVFAKMHNWHFM